MILGLTGGIATGKSTVSRMFQKRGAVIVDADKVAKEVVEPGTEGLTRIKQRFGEKIIHPDDTLNRELLGSMIFQDKHLREDLNLLLHPLIKDRLIFLTKEILRKNEQSIIIWDVPLLIEKNLTPYVEKVIVVYVPEAIQLERLRLRNGYTRDEALMRIRSQVNIEEKKRMATFVIDNSNTLEDTERQVDQLWNELILKNG